DVDPRGDHPVVGTEYQGAEGATRGLVDVARRQRDRERHLVGVAAVGSFAIDGTLDPPGQLQGNARGKMHHGTPAEAAGSQVLATQEQAWISLKPHTLAMPDSAQAACTAAGSGWASTFTQAGKWPQQLPTFFTAQSVSTRQLRSRSGTPDGPGRAGCAGTGVAGRGSLIGGASTVSPGWGAAHAPRQSASSAIDAEWKIRRMGVTPCLGPGEAM